MTLDVCFRKYRAVRSLSVILTLVATLLVHSAAAQTPMKEVIDVRVTNVEIIATDAKGKHISGLTRDDFELYENGKLQPITNLFEASAKPQDASERPCPAVWSSISTIRRCCRTTASRSFRR